MPLPMPLLMVLEFCKHHDDDRMEHHLRFGVAGMPHPLDADVETDFYENPRIEVCRDAGIRLSPELLDRLVIAAFEQLVPTLDGTDIGEMFFPDATPWIENVFAADAPVVLAELRRHVIPGLVRDGERYSSLIPLYPPAKGAQP